MTRKSTLAESVKSRLEKEIFEGRYLPGDRLREDVISREYGASRTPVREAFKHLAASGLISVQPHQGAVVRKLEIGELAEMFQVMAELEGLCSRLAAKRIRPDQKRKLEQAHKECARLARGGRHEEFYQANNIFHELIHEISGNRFLHRETENLARRLNPYRRQITFHPGRMIDSIREHEAVMRAIIAGNAETAGETMRRHVNILGDQFGDYLEMLSLQPQRMTRRRKRTARSREKAPQESSMAT
jgi:DNA-binding GntR family transcriptional regulator